MATERERICIEHPSVTPAQRHTGNAPAYTRAVHRGCHTCRITRAGRQPSYPCVHPAAVPCKKHNTLQTLLKPKASLAGATILQSSFHTAGQPPKQNAEQDHTAAADSVPTQSTTLLQGSVGHTAAHTTSPPQASPVIPVAKKITAGCNSFPKKNSIQYESPPRQLTYAGSACSPKPYMPAHAPQQAHP